MNQRHTVIITKLVLAILLFPWQICLAHDARPLFINIEQQAPELYHASVAVPSSVESSNQPKVLWPEACTQLSQSVKDTGMAHRFNAILQCTDGIEGRKISFTYALYNPSLSTVIRFHPGVGEPRVTVLPPGRTAWTIPDRPAWWSVVREYLKLGMEHILRGFDHLLFVTGLLILARTLRRVIIVITGFTIAHSITLSLATLQLINISTVPVEAAIALSILFLASEIARAKDDSLAFRFPLLVSSGFGLLHGLGFAAVLTTIGLPAMEIPSALLCFNLGVELGQIAFILCVSGLFHLVRSRIIHLKIPSWGVLRMTAAYILGIPASYWFIQGLAQF